VFPMVRQGGNDLLGRAGAPALAVWPHFGPMDLDLQLGSDVEPHPAHVLKSTSYESLESRSRSVSST
jgi:hypothetical protein